MHYRIQVFAICIRANSSSQSSPFLPALCRAQLTTPNDTQSRAACAYNACASMKMREIRASRRAHEQQLVGYRQHALHARVSFSDCRLSARARRVMNKPEHLDLICIFNVLTGANIHNYTRARANANAVVIVRTCAVSIMGIGWRTSFPFNIIIVSSFEDVASLRCGAFRFGLVRCSGALIIRNPYAILFYPTACAYPNRRPA